MSVDVFVFLPSGALPAVEHWQGQLDSLGVDLRLSTDVTVEDHSGYWPAILEGQASGFEFFSGAVLQTFGRQPPLGAEGCELVANFVLHGDLGELKSAMLAATALAQTTGGVIIDGESHDVVTADALMADARSIES